MNKKLGLSQATLITTLGIVLMIVSVYIPILGILSLATSVPFAIIGTLCDKKYNFLSLIATFFILMFFISPIYSVSTCVMSVIPGLIIGSIAKNNIDEEYSNKYVPIYGGTIAFIVCTIAFYFIAKSIFNMDLVKEFNDAITIAFEQQMNIMQNSGLYESINIKDFTNIIQSLIPTVLFLQGLFLSFITYYLEVFILKRTRILSLEKPKFKEFYLPGNAVGTSLMLYLLVLLLGFMKIGLYTDSIMFNLQMVFEFMFIVQGVAVAIYYFRNWMKQGTGKNILISGILLGIFGTMAISLIGMLDSVIDFRKVRSYKST